MRKRRRYEDYGSMSELNVTPLLDLAFTLLVIFIVTMPLLGKKADLVLPSSEASRDAVNPSDVHVVSIDANKNLLWDGQPVSRAGLEVVLEGLGEARDRSGVVIEADRTLSVQDAVEILDLVSENGISKASIVTGPAPQPAP
ncbi:MAG: ExbD/TolR family protein [Verrucomicrobiales bacterium]